MQKPIKEIIRASGFYQWQIAECMNVSEYWFSKQMRHEPSQEIRNRILDAIETLKSKH